jgi:6-phosphogluconolactonase
MTIGIRVFKSEEALHRASAERVAELASEAISRHGAFFLALSGGITPQGLYRVLAEPQIAANIDWSKVQVYFGDERCVSPEHPDSNYRMANETLLSHVPLPPQNLHRITCERSAEEAAESYAREVGISVPISENHLPRFDLVLLGLGLDGHVASLFPGTGILHKRVPVAAVFVDNLNAWRVSFTLPVINNALHVLLLAAGAKKADVVRHVLRSGAGAMPLPVQMIKPAGEFEWYLDAEAARDLHLATEP